MFKPSKHPTFNMVYNMPYDMFERFAPVLTNRLLSYYQHDYNHLKLDGISRFIL